jgi:DNA-binding NarL/FixJ family response regulator
MNKILVVDDHPLMREGLTAKINKEIDLTVSWEASDANEALTVFESEAPDLVIVDISMPGMNGLELIKHMQSINEDVPVIVVSRHDEVLYARRALEAGARGYVMKRKASEKVIEAIRHVLEGGIYVSSRIKQEMLETLGRSDSPREAGVPLAQLSDRELEVFELTGRGLNTREIAEQMNIAVKTVQSYRSRIKEKLNVESHHELMRRAFHWVDTGSTDTSSE